MRLGLPHILTYLIWLVPVVIFFLIWARKREKRAMESFAHKDLLECIAPGHFSDPKRLRMFLNILALLLILISLARPQWGFFWKEDQFKGLDIIIAVDASKSMLAVDVKPNRLTFAKEEIKDFVRKLEGDRVGFMAFSGQAFLQCPLTVDYKGFMIALYDLDIDTIPTGGTSIASAITEAVRAYKGAETQHKILIIITDGENTSGDLKKALALAKKNKIEISCIGIGTKEGNLIPVIDKNGKKTYVKDKSGKPVRSKLDERTLKMIAEKTGGLYVRASQSEFGLNEIYEKRLAKLERNVTKTEKVKVYKERYQFTLTLALALLLLEFFLRGKGKKEA